MVNVVRAPGLTPSSSVARPDRVSSDRPSIGAMVAVLSKELPLPNASQLAGQVVNAKLLGTDAKGNAVFDMNGQNIAVKLPPDAKLPAQGAVMTLMLALDSEVSTPATANVLSSSVKTLNSIAKIDTSDTDIAAAENSSTVDDLSSAGKLIGAIEASVKQAGASSMPTVNINLAQLAAEEVTGQLAGEASAENSTQGTQGKDASNNLQSNQPTPKGVNVPTGKIADSLINGDKQGLVKTLSDSVEHSGLFYESHLAQWADGERSAESLRKEPQALWDRQQVISDKPGAANELPTSAKLVASQLQLLDDSRLHLKLQGLDQEPVDVEIHPDDSHAGQADPQRGWSAKLKLDMKELGPIDVQIRMVGNQVDIQLGARAQAIEPINQSWPDIQSAIQDVGLELTHGAVTEKDGTP